MKEFMAIDDHTFVEFWDTDDENNHPYYVGMMDNENNEKKSKFTSTFFKSVTAELNSTEIQTWMNNELNSGYGTGACRQTRKLIREGKRYLSPPVIVSTHTEIHRDVSFYLDELSSSASIETVAYQDPPNTGSYTGYWALAAHGYKPAKKGKFAPLSEKYPGLFDRLYDECEDKSQEDYTNCRADVKEEIEILSKTSSINAISTTTTSPLTTLSTTTITPLTTPRDNLNITTKAPSGRRHLSAERKSHSHSLFFFFLKYIHVFVCMI